MRGNRIVNPGRTSNPLATSRRSQGRWPRLDSKGPRARSRMLRTKLHSRQQQWVMLERQCENDSLNEKPCIVGGCEERVTSRVDDATGSGCVARTQRGTHFVQKGEGSGSKWRLANGGSPIVRSKPRRSFVYRAVYSRGAEEKRGGTTPIRRRMWSDPRTSARTTQRRR